MSSVFRTKNLQDTGIDDVFFLEKSCRKMYTIFSAVQRQQRKSDITTSFGLTAVYYQVPHSASWLSGGVVEELEALLHSTFHKIFNLSLMYSQGY
jgi:hypothetical protein